MWFFPLVLLVGLGVLAAGAAIYNRLVLLRNTVASAWSDIGVLLKKRRDLVDNLVETVTGYAVHEKTALSAVTEARTRAAGAASPGESSRAEETFGRMVGNLFAVAEGYPDLKANAGFLGLQQQLRDLEDQLERSRRAYNAAVRDYNTLTEAFPSNLVAETFTFARAEFFATPSPEESGRPKVSF